MRPLFIYAILKNHQLSICPIPPSFPGTRHPLVRTSLCDVKGVPGKKTPSDPSEMSDPSSPGTNHGKENIDILEKPTAPVRPIGLISVVELS